MLKLNKKEDTRKSEKNSARTTEERGVNLK
jgi:hypothetical protein